MLMMTRKFSELVAKMSPEARAESEREARRMPAEIKLKHKIQSCAEQITEEEKAQD
jgi:hypothetical protein